MSHDACFWLEQLALGQISSVELCERYLNTIKQQTGINAFVHIDEEQALIQAKQADALRKKGDTAPLLGLPMAHKDIFVTKDMPTCCGSKMLNNYQSPFDATIVVKLKVAGSICVGKTNMDEFAMGSTNEHSYFGVVKNPWNQNHVPGGSSGGSAAAVALSLVPFATGSDTGGSIRQPAAFCGISGLKPTYGRVSRFGMIAYASSLDQGGPMARSVRDLAKIYPLMAGFDPKDSTSASVPVQSINLQPESKHAWRIGIVSSMLNHCDDDVRIATENAIKHFKEKGADIIELDFKLHDLWVPCYYIIACAEASSNLSRYDGLRFGHRTRRNLPLNELIAASRTEGFGEEVRRRILTGTHVLSSGYFDDVYLKALKVRRLILNEFNEAFNDVDVIISPATPTSAPALGSKPDPVQAYMADINTVAVNLAGLPALSIPSGFNQQGLPIGLQLIGKAFDEERLLQLGYEYQLSTDWHLKTPSLEVER